MSSTFIGLAYPLDPGFAALLGTLIGSGSSIIVQIIAAIITANNNTKAFRREQRKEEIASITDAYEYAFFKYL